LIESEADPLIFVYNADSGVINGLIDMGHKVISPQTYACSLCGVTYGLLGMKPRWRRFVQGLGRPVRFLHRDELAHEYGEREDALPAVFEEREGALRLWMTADEMNAATTLDALEEAVRLRLAEGASRNEASRIENRESRIEGARQG
jgi:hypothetical protein